MTVYEKMQTMTPDELAIFIYVHGKELKKGLKKIKEYVNSELKEEEI